MLPALLVACSPPSPPPEARVEPPPASEPSTPPPAALAWVTEAGGAPAARWSRDGAPDEPLPGLGDRPAFPADADPRLTHALVVTTADGPTGHRETLALVALDGGPPLELAAAQMIRNPRWTPDGARVVFESDAHSYRDLYRVARSGGAPERLTTTEHGCFEPALSFDGQWLAYGASTDGNAEIWVARPDGSAARRLTVEPTDDTAPAFLPDGRLSWIATREGRPRVWVADLSGANARPLRAGSGVDLAVVWSPQGVAAVTTAPGPSDVDLELVRADGSAAGRLGGPGVDEHPSFSPDGGALAFSSARGGTTAVWIARADGSGARQVSAGPGPDWLPRWLR